METQPSHFPHLPESVFKTLQVLAFLSAITGTIITIVVVVLPKLHVPIPNLTVEGGTRLELLFQMVAIFLLLGFLRPLPHVRSDSELSIAVGASQQFWRCWAFLWASWLCLYVTWFVELYIPGPHLLADLFNMTSNAALILCYIVMTLRTWPPKKYGFHQIVFWVVSACVAVSLSEFLFARNSKELQEGFHWLQGLVSGVALALLVGRLDSKLINLRRLTIAALYAYAVLQFAYPELYQKASVLLVMTSAALFLKILLFWQISRVLSSGTIFWYMHEYRRIYEEGQEEKNGFLQKLVVR
jgi:hypothetical protein